MTECAYPGWGAEVHDRSDHGQLVRQNGNIFSFDESLIYADLHHLQGGELGRLDGHLPFEKPLTSHNLHFNRSGPIIFIIISIIQAYLRNISTYLWPSSAL